MPYYRDREQKSSTLREGLLSIALSLTTCTTLLAGVVGDGSPVSSTSCGIPPFSFSCELEGPIASLLGTGVTLPVVVFLNDGFLTETFGLAKELTPLGSLLAFQLPPVEFGVPLGALEKKLRIDPFLVDPALEACFFREGGTGVPSIPSFLAIVARKVY
jgi:hypothetical protein